MAEFGKGCYGQSRIVGKPRCDVPPKWETTQEGGANPIRACGLHLTWLVGLRTAPGHSITVTRLADPS